MQAYALKKEEFGSLIAELRREGKMFVRPQFFVQIDPSNYV